jgi:hypothetical protein
LIVGIAGLWIYAWPGFMSPDSLQQLGQARSHEYSDGHPPLMSALWSLVEHVIQGPAGMLVIQSTTFVIGLFLILRRHFASPLAAAIAAVAITWFPPVFTPMGVIWKDCQMAGFLMLGIGLFGDERRIPSWIGLAVIALAIGMRHNASAAALPLVLVLFQSRRLAGRSRTVAALGLWLAVTVAAFGANRLLTKHQDHAWFYSTGPADIVGILNDAHQRYSDEELRKILEGTPLVPTERLMYHAWHSYDVTMWWPAVNGPQRLFNWPENEGHRQALRRAWRTLVIAHPYAYLHHRLNMFRTMLGLKKGYADYPIVAPVWRARADASYQLVAPSQDGFGRSLDWLGKTFLFRPFIYFFAAIALAWLMRRSREPLALLSSGLLYELTFIPFTPSIEYRYSHWMITCTVIAAVLYARQLIDAARTHRQPSSD